MFYTKLYELSKKFYITKIRKLKSMSSPMQIIYYYLVEKIF